MIDPTHLPANLPEPVDDGACEHLNGLELPPIELLSTTGTVHSLHDVSPRWLVFYVHPRTGRPRVTLPAHSDLIPAPPWRRGRIPGGGAVRGSRGRVWELDAA